MALRENLSFGEYVRKYDVTIKNIRHDTIGLMDFAKEETNQKLKDDKKIYHAITDLRQYPGETTMFGLVNEWIIMGTGVRLNKKY